MHTYLRAIGFSKPIGRSELFSIIEEGVKNPRFAGYVSDGSGSGSLMAQFNIELGEGFGLSVFGTFDAKDHFYPDFYFPYFEASSVSSMEKVSVEKRLDNNSFSGMCDDLRLGISTIFRLQNGIEYLRNIQKDPNALENASLSLSALSVEGKIILPIYKEPSEMESGRRQSLNRRKLMSLAKEGDEESAKRLSIMDMESTTNAYIQLENGDDLYSIVDSSFMPYGIECELYSVLGEIKRVSHALNRITLDDIVRLTIDINGLEFDLGISAKDLVGEPTPGMRFKGVAWMLGKINFQDDVFSEDRNNLGD